MKKLMIALGAVAVAAAVQASSFDWTVDGTTWQCLPGNEDAYFTGTAYFFDSAAVGQQAVLNAFNAGTFESLTYLASLDLDEGEAGGKNSATFAWGNKGDTLTGYYATLFNDGKTDYLFISNTADGIGQESATTTIYVKDVTGPSALAAVDSPTFGGSAWYAYQSATPTPVTPEPTSGLLLLIGVAGLALRRRRA